MGRLPCAESGGGIVRIVRDIFEALIEQDTLLSLQEGMAKAARNAPLQLRLAAQRQGLEMAIDQVAQFEYLSRVGL